MENLWDREQLRWSGLQLKCIFFFALFLCSEFSWTEHDVSPRWFEINAPHSSSAFGRCSCSRVSWTVFMCENRQNLETFIKEHQSRHIPCQMINSASKVKCVVRHESAIQTTKKNTTNEEREKWWFLLSRAYRGHSFQQQAHFLSLNEPHANDEEWR